MFLDDDRFSQVKPVKSPTSLNKYRTGKFNTFDSVLATIHSKFPELTLKMAYCKFFTKKHSFTPVLVDTNDRVAFWWDCGWFTTDPNICVSTF